MSGPTASEAAPPLPLPFELVSLPDEAPPSMAWTGELPSSPQPTLAVNARPTKNPERTLPPNTDLLHIDFIGIHRAHERQATSHP